MPECENISERGDRQLCIRRDQATVHLNPNSLRKHWPGSTPSSPTTKPAAISSSRSESTRPASPRTYSPNSTTKQSPCSQRSKDTRCASRRLLRVSSMRTRNMSSLRRLHRSAGSSVLLDITLRSSNSPEPASPWGKPGKPDDVGPGAREDSADQDSRVVAESGPISGIDVYQRRPRRLT